MLHEEEAEEEHGLVGVVVEEALQVPHLAALPNSTLRSEGSTGSDVRQANLQEETLDRM